MLFDSIWYRTVTTVIGAMVRRVVYMNVCVLPARVKPTLDPYSEAFL